MRSDHLPFTFHVNVPLHGAAHRPPVDRLRQAWDITRNDAAWQGKMADAMRFALIPLQPMLTDLSNDLLAPGITAQQAMDSAYSAFESAFLDCCHEVVGKKVVRPFSNPWYGYPGVRQANREEHQARKLRRNHRTSADHRTHHLNAIRRWKDIRAEAMEHAAFTLCSQVMEPGMSKLTWAAFSRTAPSTLTSLTSIAHPMTGELPADRASSLDNLCTAFVNNGIPPPAANPTSYTALVSRVDDMADPAHPTATACPILDGWCITADMVKQQCTRQHTNSAPGPDAILPIFLKHAGDEVWAALAVLYSFSWRHSVTPQAWREANVMALYKGDGSKAEAGNYRPISMTSIVVRTLEHIIHHRLTDLLDSEQEGKARTFASHQFGFRRQHATTDAIFYLLSSIQSVMRCNAQGLTAKEKQGKKKREKTDRWRAMHGLSPLPPPPHSQSSPDKLALQCPVLFLDIQKAFDRVDHHILLHRLHQYGVRGKAWMWIRSFLSHRRMRTLDSSTYSSWQQVGYGVPQGCVLSPLLFLIFIDAVQKHISTTCPLLAPIFFADDGAIGPRHDWEERLGKKQRATFAATYREQMVRAIGHLQQWCDDSRMRFGSKKTQLVMFTSRRLPDLTDYTGSRSLVLCDFHIGIADSYRYLGLQLHRSLRWQTHFGYIRDIARQCGSRVGRVAMQAKGAVHFNAVRALVMSYVIPSLTYALLFWGHRISEGDQRKIQRWIAHPLRCALSLPPTTHQLSVLEMCGVPSLSALCLTAQMAHLTRVQRLPLTHPARALHDYQLTHPASSLLHNVLTPAYALSPTLHTAAVVLPQQLHDPALLPLHPTHVPHPQPTPPHEWERAVTYWEGNTDDRQHQHATAGRFQPTHLASLITHYREAVPLLTHAHTRTYRDRRTHAEWRAQCVAPPPAPVTIPPSPKSARPPSPSSSPPSSSFSSSSSSFSSSSSSA